MVRLVVNKDGGVTLDDAADVGRTIRDILDRLGEAEPDAFETSYVLEHLFDLDRDMTAAATALSNTGRPAAPWTLVLAIVLTALNLRMAVTHPVCAQTREQSVERPARRPNALGGLR